MKPEEVYEIDLLRPLLPTHHSGRSRSPGVLFIQIVFKDLEECFPTGIHDGFRQVMIFQYVYDLKIAVRMSLGDTVGIKERAGEPDILGHFVFLPL